MPLKRLVIRLFDNKYLIFFKKWDFLDFFVSKKDSNKFKKKINTFSYSSIEI